MKNIWVRGMLLFATSLTGCDNNEAAKPAENQITTLLSEESGALKIVEFRSNGVAGKLTQLGSRFREKSGF